MLGAALAVAGLFGAGTASAADIPAPDITTAAALQQRLGADAAIALWPAERLDVPPALNTGADFVTHPDLATVSVAHPYLFVFRPAHPNGRALISVPGGGYHFVSVDNEGLAMAQRFVPRGYTVFVLVYRLPTEGWANPAEVAFADGQRAVRLVRARAGEYGIDPHQIGVMGFSAGGQLVSDLATSFARDAAPPADDIDRQSARPDWAALIYPVVLLEPPYTHTATYKAIGGPNDDAETLLRHGAIHHVGADTPSMFLLHAADDQTVPVENSLLLAQAMMAAHRPVELHIVPHGGHGFGGRVGDDLLLGHWTDMVLNWRDMMAKWPDQER